MSESSRQGKIARLPQEVREEVNRRLVNGRSGREILAWLNVQPEVLAVLRDQFEGVAVSEADLTRWRQGGYAAWLARQEHLDQTRQFAEFSMDLARAGGGTISEGAAAIAAGKIMNLIESITYGDGGDEADPKEKIQLSVEQLKTLADSIAKLRSGDLLEKRLGVERMKLAQKDKEIAQGERRLKLLEDKVAEAKAKLTTVAKKGGVSPETMKLVKKALGML